MRVVRGLFLGLAAMAALGILAYHLLVAVAAFLPAVSGQWIGERQLMTMDDGVASRASRRPPIHLYIVEYRYRIGDVPYVARRLRFGIASTAEDAREGAEIRYLPGRPSWSLVEPRTSPFLLLLLGFGLVPLLALLIAPDRVLRTMIEFAHRVPRIRQ